MIQTTVRHADLGSMVEILRTQQVRKVDMVAPATKFKSEEGLIVVKGVDPVITDDGVTLVDGTYRPTGVFDEGVSEKLGIPLAYVRKIRDQRPDLYDANVNGWLHGRKAKYSGPVVEGGQIIREAIPGDGRSFLLRAFKGDDGEPGIARALLSNSYSRMDNLDVLMSVLDGVRSAGVDVVIDGCDLTDRRMYVRVVCPQVKVVAESLLRDYRNPFGPEFARWREIADSEGMGYGGEEPVVFAGFEISNSEVGDGAFSIVPRMVIKVCRNGLKITADAIRQVHLGSRLSDGIIEWSADTEDKNLALVKAKTRDAVSTFLDVDYITRAIARIEEKAGKPISDPTEHVKVVAKKMLYTDEQTNGILAHFIRGGQTTAGGLMNAVTSYAQMVDDADTAARLEDGAVRAMELVAAL